MRVTRSRTEWWGYLHRNGTVHLRRALVDVEGDIREARESPFVDRVAGPFEAGNRDEANRELRVRLGVS